MNSTSQLGDTLDLPEDSPEPKAPHINDETLAAQVLEDASNDKSPESYSTVKNKVYYQSHFDFEAKELYTQELKDGDIRRRPKQAILHVTFTEIRIAELEKQVETLSAQINKLPDDFKPNMLRSRWPVYGHFLKRSSQAEFQTSNHTKGLPELQLPAVESLSNEGELLKSTLGETMDSCNEGTLTVQKSPERLRIRSAPLISHLEMTCRESLSNHQVWSDEAPVTLLRPFKLLVTYEEDIRASVKMIEERAKSSTGGEKGMKESKPVLSEKEYEHKDLLQDLKCLIEFLDVDLKPTFDLRQSIANKTATEIEYADLWHLFKLGDVVISPAHPGQAFRVVKATGGRPPLTPKYPVDGKLTNSRSLDGFVVDCCGIQFDGYDYVPLLKKITIRKYVGHRPIDSLEVYPLNMSQNFERLHCQLIDQGRKYLDLTRSPFSHKAFEGITMDEPYQDLEAQVIVDIALALNNQVDWRVPKTIRESNLTEDDLCETSIRNTCNHNSFGEGCCGSDYIAKDMEMRCFQNDPFKRHYGGLLSARSASEIPEEDLILMPPWIRGFVLRNRQWVTMRIADLSEVQFKNDLNNLMISDNHKKTIVALVKTHENAHKSDEEDAPAIGTSLDVVRGKGTGLIILLHGEPGE